MRTRRSERGIVFVIALAVLAALVAILAATAASQRVAMRAETNRIDERRARLMAQAGIQRAIAELANEAAAQQGGASTGSGSTSTQPTNATTTQDDWATLGTNGADRFIVGDSDFRLQIVDACSLIDLNTAPETQLDQLPLTPDQIDSLLDWRESSTTPRPDGAKDDYYNNLQNPYNTALRRLDTLDELMQVKGFTAQTIYTPQTNIGSTATIVQGSSDQQPTLYDLCTVESYAPMTRASGQALINVNAGGSTITKLQRLAQAGITGNLAERIIQIPNFASVGAICAQAGTGPQDYRLIWTTSPSTISLVRRGASTLTPLLRAFSTQFRTFRPTQCRPFCNVKAAASRASATWRTSKV